MVRSGVYMIRNMTRGLVYIGSSIKIRERMKQHRRALIGKYHENQKLQRAWNKYGELSFEFSIVESVEDNELLHVREQAWIDRFDSSGDGGYNLCPAAGSCAGYKHSPETIAKRRGRIPWNKGVKGYKIRVAGQERNRKIGDAQRGPKNHNYGRTTPESVKQKCRDSYRGAQCHLAKLDDNKVMEIKRSLSAGARGVDLAKKYGVSKTQISSIKNGRTWKHVKQVHKFPGTSISVSVLTGVKL